MPIYKQQYRQYSGVSRHHFRWVVIIEQELHLAMQSRLLKYLMLFGLLHVLMRLAQIMIYDIIMQDPNNPMTQAFLQLDFIVVNARTFFDFIRMQATLLLLVFLVMGSGMVCNDFKNNLMEVYFAKPLNWKDYVLGKLGALVLVGLCLTAIPGTLLVILHNLLLPGWNTLQETWTFPFAMFGFSLLIILPTALSILAASCLMSSESFAAAAVFVLVVTNGVFASTLSGILFDPRYMIISTPLAVYRLGLALFTSETRYIGQDFMGVGWQPALVNVLLVCVVAGSIFILRVRKAEVAV